MTYKLQKNSYFGLTVIFDEYSFDELVAAEVKVWLLEVKKWKTDNEVKEQDTISDSPTRLRPTCVYRIPGRACINIYFQLVSVFIQMVCKEKVYQFQVKGTLKVADQEGASAQGNRYGSRPLLFFFSTLLECVIQPHCYCEVESKMTANFVFQAGKKAESFS